MSEITTGGLLGGSVTYRQLRTGHRTGFEPVLLAASIPATPGDRVLEAGTGAGAALLCLAARVPGLTGTGVERDEALSRLANENFKINKLPDISCIQADATRLPFTAQTFDHVLANPPWFDARSTASPDARRALAHQAGPDLLAAWIASLISVLRPKGSITLILPASSFAICASELRSTGCGGITLFPLWPRAGQPAKMVIISACKGAKSPDRVMPGLVLHDDTGITEAAQKILRNAQTINCELNTA
jgi:tRNA1Val (adenine37-N6)-methyltransferase